MNLQEILAGGIAGLCALWLVWKTVLRPFLRRGTDACTMCSACGPPKAATGPSARGSLVQIEPVDGPAASAPPPQGRRRV